MKRVRVYIPLMDRAWFIVHDQIKDGYIFGVKHEYKTAKGIPMYELCGASGKTIPWRNKIMQKWCIPVYPLEYAYERHVIATIHKAVAKIKRALSCIWTYRGQT